MVRLERVEPLCAGRWKAYSCLCLLNCQFRLILPAVTALGIRLSHASREGSALGVLLSNTWITYPGMGDNLGKLRIIPHRSGRLECVQAENSGVPGWVCGLSGCSECKGLTSRRRVRAMGVVARRWILRHESRPYGAQQARKLYNAGNRDKGTLSASTMCWLSACINHMCQQGPGKTGASRRGNTGGPSGGHYYWV
jgi:hypothetical protein